MPRRGARNAVPDHHAVPGGGATDQLRRPCHRRRAEPGNHPTGSLPQGIRVHQRPVRRHHETRDVRLLDYEVEIGLVIGRDMPVGTTITEANLSEHICGLVVANDVSARDMQLTKTQFYEAKSSPTFTPVGPALVLLNADELKRFGDMRLRLRVNGEIRQDTLVEGDIIYPPVQALEPLSRFQRLDAGDLVLTGTPVGTAISAPPKRIEVIGSLLPDQLKWRIFFSRQAKNPKYLRRGDVVEAAVATDDGAIDLGAQRTVVNYR
jgi:2-keto-4-pentenoate hydratase/2-oxohepta-3-ene-1,7-dioic acid hydratase in catechol pathway